MGILMGRMVKMVKVKLRKVMMTKLEVMEVMRSMPRWSLLNPKDRRMQKVSTKESHGTHWV